MNLKQVRDDLEQTNTLKLISGALGEIATIKLKENRANVERNINFFHQVMDVYSLVRRISQKEGLKAKKTIKNGKTVSVLITSNYKFNGNLDKEAVEFFINRTAQLKGERLVIGKIGMELLSSAKYPTAFLKNIFFKKDVPDEHEFKVFTEMISSYSQILVFYSKFVTVMDQQPTMVDISTEGVPMDTSDKTDPAKLGLDYILEPEIGKMLEFFDTQILQLLIDSILLESEIARIAARMISMDQAEQSANKQVSEQKKQLRKAIRMLNNERILESFSGRKRRII